MPVKERYPEENQEFSQEVQQEESTATTCEEEKAPYQTEEEAQKEVWEACTESSESETGEEKK